MEGTKNKFIGLLILTFLPVLFSMAQPRDLVWYQCAFYESYRGGDMTRWPKLIEEMEQAKSTDQEWQTETLKAIYGLVGYQVGQGMKNTAKIYIEKADKYLDQLLIRYPKNAQLQSLAGAFYAYKISLAAYKAPLLGPKSLEHINKAIKLDPAEPMGYVEKGNSLAYRPAAFGGDKKEALKFYRKALALFESRPDNKCNWQQMLLRAFILKTLYETNQKSEAESFLASMHKDYGQISWIKAFIGTDYMNSK